MKEIELISKRKPREKHFLKEDGTIVARIYDSDIHYKLNGKYEEINNELIKSKSQFINCRNDFKVSFEEEIKDSMMKVEKEKYYLQLQLRDSDKVHGKKKRNDSKKNLDFIYENIQDGIDIEYKLLSNKIKETIVLNKKTNKNLVFDIITNLKLVESNKNIIAMANNEIKFTIEKPYMEDSLGNKNNNIFYNLKELDNKYELELCLDNKWLNEKDRCYPVYIDPTITNDIQSIDLFDTYIFQGDTGIDKNNMDVLKAGIEKVNGQNIENKTLIKFSLPEIGTGSQIVGATIMLTGYLPSYNHDIAESKLASIHRITKDWNENEASWETMNTGYDKKVESIFECYRSSVNGNILLPSIMYADITNIVKKWYSGTANHGILIQSVDKNFIDNDYQAFFSKNNTISGENPKPLIEIAYRNQNGLESYLDYQKQDFTEGTAYINTFNGNMTTSFNLGNTIGGVLPVSLDLIYNTNDVVLKNETNFGKGFKLNLEQTIKEIVIDNQNYLEYVDADGTIHYFYQNMIQGENKYYDEDGLNLIIEKENNKCILKDKYNNSSMNFILLDNDVYHLNEMTDSDGNINVIEFDTNNRIQKVKDRYNSEVTIEYSNNTITINSPDRITTLDFDNNKIVNINTIMGTTKIEYNNYGLISKIEDITGIKVLYEYYEQMPYRMKKVLQYSIDDNLGQYFTLEYGFNTTKIIDNNGKTQNIIYNSDGNVLSRNSLKTSEDINDAYSLVKAYGIGNSQNKVTASQVPITYVKNYLKNTSFERNENYFVADNEITSEISAEYSNYGNKSLKVISSSANKYLTYSIDVPKGHFYTFSGYFKNANNLEIMLSYTNEENIEIIENQLVRANENFGREDVTIFYENNASSPLKIKIKALSVDIFYVDNIQLEKGEVANLYNFIENSDFSEGYGDWSCDILEPELTETAFNVVKFNNELNTALKVSMHPICGSGFNKVIPINGKKGDLYTVSFWYKNEGISAYRPHGGNYVVINFHPVDGEAEYCFIESPNLNSNDSIWQYFSHTDYALEDFDEINIAFIQQDQANDFYITNISLFHNITSGFYEYDENGNLVLSENQDNKINTFSYDINNQLIKNVKPNGTEYNYEYDNNKKSRLLNAISSGGISNKIKYDMKGNQTSTKIEKLCNTNVESGNFKIRAKGTNKYLKAELNQILLEENDCSNTIWTLSKNSETAEYEIQYTVNPNYYLAYEDGTIVLSTNKTQNIYLELNDDSSYYFAVLTEDGVKYLKATDNQLIIEYLDRNAQEFKFYIEYQNEKFVESNINYDENGRFISTVTDEKLRKNIYEINQTTGQIEKIIKPNNLEIKYNYNLKGQPISVETGNKIVSYEYGTKNEIKKLSTGNLSYDVTYDDFIKTKNIKINNEILLIENDYNAYNGNLSSITYGNNQSILLDYDDFDRISNVQTEDNEFKYRYDNNGNISKILSNSEISRYVYDTANRITKYKQGDYSIDYEYDSNNNLIKKIYSLNNNKHIVKNTLAEDDILIKKEFDNINVNYQYDELYRLLNMNIDDVYNVTNEYLSYGKRVTDIIKKVSNGDSAFEYEYDKIGNIETVKYNNQLLEKYNYNQYGELIEEEQYTRNKKIQYQYDLYGNILSKTIINLENNTIENTIVYSYENNNWRDQLTKYDSTIIMYDNAGNIEKIGDSINLSWKNGHELKKYENLNQSLIVEYDYNQNGIRTSKKVNGVETKYYLENNKIIFEKTENDLLYFFHDKDNIIGFNYNGETYIYEKNIQGDVISIVDINNNKVVEYKYNSWGKIIEIIDSTNQRIGDINPYRYRSYYYDKETGLYYLNTRYYNPEFGRFISPDNCIGLNGDHIGYNLYTYVSNNPINNIDPNGKFLKKAWDWLKKKTTELKNKLGRALGITNQNNTTTTNNTNKTSKTSSSSKNKAKENDSGINFVAEVGGGIGASLEFFKVQLGGYQDLTYGYSSDDGFYQNITGSGGIGAGILSGSETYIHEYPFEGRHPGLKHTPFNINAIQNCPHIEQSYSIGMFIFDYDTDGTLFIGLEADIHVLFGVHIKFGVEL